MLLDLLVIGAAGSLGAIARYLCSLLGRTLAPDAGFPYATLAINVLGCLLIGVVMAIVERAGPFHRPIFLIAAVGFLGSFTTFSTFSFETLQLFRGGQGGLAALYAVASVALGLGAVQLGRVSAQLTF